MFSQMSLHIPLLSQVPARSLAPPHSPAPSLRRHRWSTSANLRRSLKFHPPLHRQRACTSQSRLLPIRSLAHFLAFPLRRLLQDPLSTTRKTLVPHVLVIPPPSSSAGRVYHCSLRSIALSTNPAGKSTWMTLN